MEIFVFDVFLKESFFFKSLGSLVMRRRVMMYQAILSNSSFAARLILWEFCFIHFHLVIYSLKVKPLMWFKVVHFSFSIIYALYTYILIIINNIGICTTSTF